MMSLFLHLRNLNDGLEVINIHAPISCQFVDNNLGLSDNSYDDRNGKTFTSAVLSRTFVTMLNVIRKLLAAASCVGKLCCATYKTEQLWRLHDGWLWHVRCRKNATDTEQLRNMQLFTGNAEMAKCNHPILSVIIISYTVTKTRDHQLPRNSRVPNFPWNI